MTRKRTHEEEYIARNGHLVHKIRAQDSSGRWAYYFVYVPASRERVFTEAINSDRNVDLSDYGTVIASCYGEEPTETVKKLLKEKYDFDV